MWYCTGDGDTHTQPTPQKQKIEKRPSMFTRLAWMLSSQTQPERSVGCGVVDWCTESYTKFRRMLIILYASARLSGANISNDRGWTSKRPSLQRLINNYFIYRGHSETIRQHNGWHKTSKTWIANLNWRTNNYSLWSEVRSGSIFIFKSPVFALPRTLNIRAKLLDLLDSTL